MAQVSTKRFIVWFNELERWDVKYFSSRLNSKYPIRSIKYFIKEHSEKINLFNFPENTFRILGVNNISGVFHAYDISGKKINQPYKKVNSGDLAYNPYRVNVGSIGIVPENLSDNFISPAYVIFSVDQRYIIPKLLELIIKSKWFNQSLRAATAGSVRQNLTFELLGSLEIPLPPLNIQQVIIEKWEKVQKETEEINKSIQKHRDAIDNLFLKDLGLTLPSQTSFPAAFAVWWKDFLRWSVSYNQAIQRGIDITKGKYPVIKLGTIIERMQYGTSEKANNSGIGTPILRINNIKNRTLELSDLKFINLQKEALNSLLLKNGDILIIRTSGSRDLVGTSAVFHESGEYIFASYLIRIRLNEKKANPNFISWFINSPIGRQQVNAISRQIMQNNINSKELCSIKVPLPPVEVQQKIMEKVEEGRLRIARDQQIIEQKSRGLNEEIEALILGTKEIT